MFAAAVAVILILLIVFIILSLWVTVSVNLLYSDRQSTVNVTLEVLGMKIFQKRQSAELVQRGSEEPDAIRPFDEQIELMYIHIKKAFASAMPILRQTVLHEMRWVSEGGTGEVISTGIASGGAWTLKTGLAGFLHGLFRRGCEPYLLVRPSFEKRYFRSEFDCMASIRLGKAMLAFISIKRLRTELAKTRNR